MNSARTLLLVAAAASASTVLAAGAARLAPIADAESLSRHAPYEMGQCDICHDSSDKARTPGSLLKQGNGLCFDCHEDFKATVKGHPAAKSACVGCHSPHNARKKKLLL
jgi:predicted CXXCH cytochrome family protein